jgi:hypothetical protein
MPKIANRICRHPDGCRSRNREAITDGWCRMHYQRVHRTGDPGSPEARSPSGPTQIHRRRALARSLSVWPAGTTAASASFARRGVVMLRAGRAKARRLSWNVLRAWERLEWVELGEGLPDGERAVRLTRKGKLARTDPEAVD